ncbi:Hypothetical predicted protein [Paramuricea clavata]|uniref:Uncharacterized protein n=1 Tax=Paramuricea clavata TaxID=317549 RepID=A0A7D9IZV8_PARCT|nr:Hypothetical predicted protein [Paramuricea clavata]
MASKKLSGKKRGRGNSTGFQTSAFDAFFTHKQRRMDNTGSVGSSDTVNVHDQEMEDESLCEQEEFEDNAGMMGTEEEVDAAVNLFKLSAVDLEEYDTDSDVEDSTDSDYDSSDSD